MWECSSYKVITTFSNKLHKCKVVGFVIPWYKNPVIPETCVPITLIRTNTL